MLIIASCGKFEEGPKVSIKSKKSRLCKTWVSESMTVNGIAAPDSAFSGAEITFERDGVCKMGYTGFSFESEWEFSGDVNLNIITSFSGLSSTETIEILKLKSKELWIKDVDAGVITETHMIPK